MAVVTVANVVITGANSGIGKEVARQLALRKETKMIYLAVRNEQKGIAALRELEKATGRSIFRIVHVDISSLESVRELIRSLSTPVDALVMNAGGFGQPDPGALTKQGVTQLYASNLLGHVALLEGLLAADKLTTQAVFVGSEAARGIPRMGMQRPRLASSSTEDFLATIRGQQFDGKKFDVMAHYGAVKYIAALWIAQAARQHPNVRLVTVSPGGTSGTGAISHLPVLWRFILENIAPSILRPLKLLHSLEMGAKRIVDVLTDDRFQSGHFYASKAKVMSGPMIDQNEIWADLANPSYQANATLAVHHFL